MLGWSLLAAAVSATLVLNSSAVQVAISRLDNGSAVDAVRPYIAPSHELQKVMPLAFLHVPKCGSSFVNTLLNLPGVCPGLAENTVLNFESYGRHFLTSFWEKQNVSKICPGLDLERALSHVGFGDARYGARKGHMVTFLRQPEERVISAYHDLDWAIVQGENLNQPGRSWSLTSNVAPRNAKDFAHRISGCATRMLTRSGYACAESDEPVTAEEVALAKKRLREDFAFVGLSQQWDLSICLFSAMFKVPCHSSQFLNSRPGLRVKGFYEHGADKLYSTRVLGGFKDPDDGAVYEEAQRIFAGNLERYGVNTKMCRKTCYRQAGHRA